MQKQRLAYAGANQCGRNPHVIQLRFLLAEDQRVKADQFLFVLRRVHFVGRNKLRRDRQIILPVLDPMLRLTPMPFGIVSDLG